MQYLDIFAHVKERKEFLAIKSAYNGRKDDEALAAVTSVSHYSQEDSERPRNLILKDLPSIWTISYTSRAESWLPPNIGGNKLMSSRRR